MSAETLRIRNSQSARAFSVWDRPEILNAIAGALCAAAGLLGVYAALHYAVRLPAFQLREVRVVVGLGHVTSDQVEAIVKRELKGNFFTLDMAVCRAAFEKLPWVRKVKLRRQWPDRLEVALEEHLPLARWGGAALVNTHGELFAAAYDEKLPLFVGDQASVKEIAIQYAYFLRSLAAIRQAPVQVQLSPRRAWRVRLKSGLVIELGRENIESRLERFIAVYDRTLGTLQRRLDYVDLRYRDGFAVRIPELSPAPQDKPRGARAARATG